MNKKEPLLKTTSIARWGILFLLSSVAMLLISCTAREEGKYQIRVDMSKEHDAGRFKPEQGDNVGIAGNFNGWNREDIILKDQKGDWIFLGAIDNYVKKWQAGGHPDDTLEFKFIIHPGSERKVANYGWEDVPNRRISASDIEKRKPILVFSEPYDGSQTYEVTFRVGMSNQKVLGFFQPEAGDEVIVSGTFCNWASDGVPMKEEDGGVYSAKVRVKQNPKEPFEYRYRIATKRKVTQINRGWETIVSRHWDLTDSTTEIPYTEFNDIRRVARFIIDTKQWEQEGKFRPKKGDILQIKLVLDGKETLSDALFQVGRHTYEIGLTIPLTARDVQWQIVRNIKEDLTPLRMAEVDLNGALITL
jgi:hypothetical protein